ncbi:T9SS type A sorting domain-containing protein [Winogradskyella sp. PG-2]|uniref:T9SS type A sorting domain-containing protein n=1 Tax=Winogradskyella sp. PG-2 TaxID=754409 RepID=UPI0004586718|nr:T9SS type A sorting domain-containing protein [Winogradskyella sp. PG-2]BAO75016.1 hypothetical protein WPG_0786 [Winogradskyella sp. PG-2]
MKKITLLFAAILFSFAGYAQVFPLDFDDAADAFSPFGGSGSSIIDDGGDMVLQIDGGTDNWDGASINFATYVDLSDDSNNTITFDIKPPAGAGTRDHWFKFEAGTGGPAVAEVAFSTTGDTWQTITLDFGAGLGEYATLAIFTDSGTSGGNSATGAYLFDDIAGGLLGTTPSPDPEPSGPAPVPTSADGNTYSIYNDTNSYTNALNVLYSFGTSTQIDLDATAAVNNAFKMNLNADGFGQGEGGPDDVSGFGFVTFNYWFSNSAGTAGFTFIMIDNDGAVQEFGYQIGDTGNGDAADVVPEAWTQVSIPMSYFTNLGFDSTNLFQWKVDRYNQSGDNGGFLYLDNILLTVQDPLSTNEFETVSFKAFPNPTNGDWNISGTSVINTVAVYDVLGKQVLALEPNSNDFVINASSLRTGVYFAKIEGVNGSKTFKLIKE